MAGDWIKLEHATADKPEVYKIAETLSIPPEHVLGSLVRVWIWADQQSYDGSITISDAIVDKVSRIEGFGKAMRSVNWLDDIGIPNFERHNGTTAKKRAGNQKRVESHRIRNASVTQVKLSQVTFPRPFRKVIFERDGMTCVYCGRKDGEYTPPETKADAYLSLDHVIPRSRGGDESPSNIVTSCCLCNNHKSNRTPEEAGLPWPVDVTGKRYGNVTQALPREEKRREDTLVSSEAKPPVSDSCVRVGSDSEEIGQCARAPYRNGDEIDEIIRYYQRFHPRAKPGAKERAKIKKRLSEGFSVADLCEAIEGCHVSPFHCGDNREGVKYQSMELIVRDASKVSRFIELAKAGPQRVARNQSQVERLMQEFADGEETTE